MNNYNKYKRDKTIERKVLEKYGLGGDMIMNSGLGGDKSSIYYNDPNAKEVAMGRGIANGVSNINPFIKAGHIVGTTASNLIAPKNDKGYTNAGEGAQIVANMFNPTDQVSKGIGDFKKGNIGTGLSHLFNPMQTVQDNNDAKKVANKDVALTRQTIPTVNPTGQTFAHGGKMKRPKSNKGQQQKIQQQAQRQAQQQQSQEGQQQQIQQIQQAAAEELQKGVPPKQVLQELVQQGVPQNTAMQIITGLVQEMQGQQQAPQGQEQQMPQGQPQEMEQQPQMQQAYGGNLNKENGRLSDMKSYNGLYRVSDKRSPLTYNNNDIPQSQKEGALVQYNGHTHEDGGVSLDGGNEVEGNETRNGDFIFSDRIIADPQTKKTYADISKSIDKRYKNRDDKFATEAKQMELDKLKDEQEQQKQSMNETYNIEGEQYGGDEIQQHANGGSIHIKSANRGKFTASAKRAGMGTQEYARHILANKDNYNSTLIKRANFARNFGGKHALGGNMYPDGGYLDWIKNNAGYAETQESSMSPEKRQSYRERYDQYLTDSGNSDASFYSNQGKQYIQPEIPLGLGDYGKQEPIVEEDNTTDKLIGKDDYRLRDVKTKGQVDKYGNWKNAGLTALTNLGNLYDIYRGLKGGDKIKEHRLTNATLQRLDPTRAIQEQREVGSTTNEAIRQNSNSVGSYLSNIGANTSRTQRSVADVINQYANQNTQIGNQEALNRQGVNQFNIGQAQQEEDLRQREKDISMNTLQHGLTGLSQGIGTAIVDKRVEDKFKGMTPAQIYRLGLEQNLAGGLFGTTNTGTNTVNKSSTIIDANTGEFKTSTVEKKKYGGKLKEKKSSGKSITSNKTRTSKVVDSIFNTQFIKQV